MRERHDRLAQLRRRAGLIPALPPDQEEVLRRVITALNVPLPRAMYGVTWLDCDTNPKRDMSQTYALVSFGQLVDEGHVEFSEQSCVALAGALSRTFGLGMHKGE